MPIGNRITWAEYTNTAVSAFGANFDPDSYETVVEPEKKPFDPQQIRYELEDTLLHLMKSQPKIMRSEEIGYDQSYGNRSFRHNYERDVMRNRQMFYVFYGGKKLGLVQRYPHKTATIFAQSKPKNRLVQRIFERVIAECLPEMKVTVQ